MRTIDIEFFDMTTNTFVPFGRGKKTTKWKEDDVLDQIFTKLAKKVEKNTWLLCYFICIFNCKW